MVMFEWQERIPEKEGGNPHCFDLCMCSSATPRQCHRVDVFDTLLSARCLALDVGEGCLLCSLLSVLSLLIPLCFLCTAIAAISVHLHGLLVTLGSVRIVLL